MEEEESEEEEPSNDTVPSYWYAIEYHDYLFYVQEGTGKVRLERPPSTNIVDGRFRTKWVYMKDIEPFFSYKIANKMERLIQREERKQIKAAYKEGKEAFEKQPKERFLIRLNKKDMITATKLMSLLNGDGREIKSLDIVWIGKTLRDSYYVKVVYGLSMDPFNNYNNSYYCFNIFQEYVYKFFDPSLSRKLYEARGYNFDYDGNEGTFDNCLSWRTFIDYIRELPHMQAEVKRLKALRPIAMQKYRDLQMEGLKRAYTQFERKTGKDFPVNMQNLLESYMTDKKPVLQYYQQRDNLAHIDTNLFQKNKLNE